MSFLDQSLDQIFNIRDMLRSLGFFVGFDNSKARHVLPIRFKIFLYNLFPMNSFFRSTIDDLIVNVCEVPDVLDGISTKAQIVPDNVKDERAPRMAEMRIIVYRHP